MVGVAVKVTEVPSQIVVVLAVILTDGSTELDVIVTLLLVAVGVEAQARSLVITTVTISASCSDVVVNVLLSVPAFCPFTFHW